MKFLKTHPADYCLRQRYGLASLSAVSALVIFQHNVLGWLAWVCLIPLFLSFIGLQRRHIWLLSLFFGVLWYYFGLWWINTLVAFHVLAPAGTLGVSLCAGIYFLPLGWFVRGVHKHLPLSLFPWVVAAGWIAIEYSRNFSEIAFPWNYMAYSQMPSNWVYSRSAALWGAGGVSFFPVFLSAWLAAFLIHRLNPNQAPADKTRKQLFLGLGIAVAAVVVGIIYPLATTALNKGNYRVSVTQPNISQLEKMSVMQNLEGLSEQESATRYRELEARMLRLAFQSIEAATSDSAQLVILPESTVLSSYFPYQREVHDMLSREAKARNLNIVLGADNMIPVDAYDLADDVGTSRSVLPEVPIAYDDRGTSYYAIDKLPPMLNMVSAWAFTPTEGLLPPYDKSQLVPFGERLPFLSSIAPLQNYLQTAGIAGNFVQGRAIHQLQLGECRLGPTICFESTFASVTRAHAKNQANALAILTNDSWYDPAFAISQGGFWGTVFQLPFFKQVVSLGPKQHLAQAQFRAMETGRPVFRAAMSGISAIIQSNGYISDSIPYGEVGIKTANVQLSSKDTLYVYLGDWFALLCVLLAGGTTAAMLRLQRKARAFSSLPPTQ